MPLCRHIMNRHWSSHEQTPNSGAANQVRRVSGKGSDLASMANDLQSRLAKFHAEQVTMTTESLPRHLKGNTEAPEVEFNVTNDYALRSSNYTMNATHIDRINGTDPEWRAGEDGLKINELQLIKVVVLVVVLSILLFSTCKLVMKTFSRFAGGVGRKDDSF